MSLVFPAGEFSGFLVAQPNQENFVFSVHDMLVIQAPEYPVLVLDKIEPETFVFNYGIPGPGVQGPTSHEQLENREAADAHPISSISGLEDELIEIDDHVDSLASKGPVDYLIAYGFNPNTDYWNVPQGFNLPASVLILNPSGSGYPGVWLWENNSTPLQPRGDKYTTGSRIYVRYGDHAGEEYISTVYFTSFGNISFLEFNLYTGPSSLTPNAFAPVRVRTPLEGLKVEEKDIEFYDWKSITDDKYSVIAVVSVNIDLSLIDGFNPYLNYTDGGNPVSIEIPIVNGAPTVPSVFVLTNQTDPSENGAYILKVDIYPQTGGVYDPQLLKLDQYYAPFVDSFISVFYSDVRILKAPEVDAYSIDWEESLGIPTKGALYDKLENLAPPDWVDVTNKPAFGTGALLDVPVTGDATANQLVKGDDTRLGGSGGAVAVGSVGTVQQSDGAGALAASKLRTYEGGTPFLVDNFTFPVMELTRAIGVSNTATLRFSYGEWAINGVYEYGVSAFTDVPGYTTPVGFTIGYRYAVPVFSTNLWITFSVSDIQLQQRNATQLWLSLPAGKSLLVTDGAQPFSTIITRDSIEFKADYSPNIMRINNNGIQVGPAYTPAFTGTIPAGRDIYVQHGIITGHS